MIVPKKCVQVLWWSCASNCIGVFQQVAQLQQSLEEAENQNMTINQEYRKLLAEKQVWCYDYVVVMHDWAKFAHWYQLYCRMKLRLLRPNWILQSLVRVRTVCFFFTMFVSAYCVSMFHMFSYVYFWWRCGWVKGHYGWTSGTNQYQG